MRKVTLIYLSVLSMCMTAPNFAKAQGIFDNDPEEQIDEADRQAFSNDPIFESKKTVTRRGSGGFDNTNMTFGGNTPIDGGLGVMVGGLVGYGIRRIRKNKNNKKNNG